MLLTPYGYREWMLISAIALPLIGVSLALQWWWPAALLAIVWFALLSFFRDPIRSLPKNLQPGDMVCPADGVVSAVETIDHHDATGGPAVIIRIFLSVLNVHVNRAPYDGEIVGLKYVPGQFLNAQTEESARVNEYNLITMRIHGDQVTSETIGIRQVSGMIARTIVCPLKVGDRLKRGQKFGMIKFGSTTELILPRPDDVDVQVKKGDKVKGGRKVIATLRPMNI